MAGEPSNSILNLPFSCLPPLLDLSAGKLGSVLLGLSLCLQTMVFGFMVLRWRLPKFARLSSSVSNLASLTNFTRDPIEIIYRIHRGLQSWNIHVQEMFNHWGFLWEYNGSSVCFLDSFQPGGACRCRYQVVPGSCRGGSLEKSILIRRKRNQWPVVMCLKYRSNAGCSSCKAHQRMSKRSLRCWWDDVKDVMHNWLE